MSTVNHIVKTYGDKLVLNDISFQVKKGEPFSIIGRNGAGKSTIIKVILGLIKANAGNVHFSEEVVVGYLPEERGLYAESTVIEHLKLFAKLFRVKKAEVSDVVSTSLHRFELEKYKNAKVKALSKGNAQKLQLALTFLGNPNLIILDEPLSGLDPINKNLLKKVIHEEKEQAYIILSSHQMEFIDEICSEVAFIKNGEIIDSGSMIALKRKYGKRKLLIPNDPQVLAALTGLKEQ